MLGYCNLMLFWSLFSSASLFVCLSFFGFCLLRGCLLFLSSRLSPLLLLILSSFLPAFLSFSFLSSLSHPCRGGSVFSPPRYSGLRFTCLGTVMARLWIADHYIYTWRSFSDSWSITTSSNVGQVIQSPAQIEAIHVQFKIHAVWCGS